MTTPNSTSLNIDTIEDPNAYLFRTAMNLFGNRLRRASVAARKVLALTSSIDDLAAIEGRDEVVRWLRPLPPRQRAAVVLTIYLGSWRWREPGSSRIHDRT